MVAPIRLISPWFAAALMATAAGVSRADVLETFDAGTQDLGGWYLTSTPGYLRQIETTGGNPGGWLHAQIMNGSAAWGTTGSNAFTGDWAARGVTSFAVDLSILSVRMGSPAPIPFPPPSPVTTDLLDGSSDRAVTLTVRWAGNVEAIYVGPDITAAPTTWQHYAFAVDANSATLPSGWTMSRYDGQPATDADWQALMQHVDTVVVGYWKPGYFYPSGLQWDVGLDNVQLLTSAVPEPATTAMFALGLAAVAITRRQRRCT